MARRFALVAILGVTPVNAAHAQESPAVDHATRVLDLLDAGKFEEVAATPVVNPSFHCEKRIHVGMTRSFEAGLASSVIRVVTAEATNLEMATGA
jgi:hypothetical protein